jgi:hypothetical protein
MLSCPAPESPAVGVAEQLAGGIKHSLALSSVNLHSLTPPTPPQITFGPLLPLCAHCFPQGLAATILSSQLSFVPCLWERR